MASATARSAPHQQFDDIVVTEAFGHIEGGCVVVEDPSIDIAATIADLLARRRPFAVMNRLVLAVPDAMIQCFRIVAQATLDEGRIAQSDGNEDVEPGAAIDEQPRDLGRLAD